MTCLLKEQDRIHCVDWQYCFLNAATFVLTMPLQCHAQVARRSRTLCTASQDPWKTLGVPHDANEAAIKKAYRKLALQYVTLPS